MAVTQNGIKTAHDEYTYTQLYNDAQNILNDFNEASNTKLTDEQGAYLEAHMEQLQSKGEGIIYNLQKAFNYVSDIREKYGLGTENTRKRSTESVDKYTDDTNQMKDYLITHYPAAEVKTATCNYAQLNDSINNENTKDKYDLDKVIVQIRDSDDNIRYMNLISINKDRIVLVSGSQKFNFNKDQFDTLVWTNDGDFVNHDRNFNIIIVYPNCVRDKWLMSIWEKQDSELSEHEKRIDTYIKVGLGLIGMGVSLFVGGVMFLIKLCYDNRVNPQAVQAVAQVAAQVVAQVVPAQQPAEGLPLIQRGNIDQCFRSYGSAVYEGLIPNKRVEVHPNVWAISLAAVMTSGILITTAGLSMAFGFRETLSNLENIHLDLKKYKPSTI
jgi:hypothetical protein